ncbi:MAG TPA: hypothetical protein DCW42_03380, partial [Bacteroidetes bacterium]|nr:hypothetical protein [Bacteroidota bacterium]
PKEIQVAANCMIVRNDKIYFGSSLTKNRRNDYKSFKNSPYISIYSISDQSWKFLIDTVSEIGQSAINCFAVS